MKIRNIELKYGIFLAPMAGVTDICSRQIYKSYGAEYMTTEMVSAAALYYGDKKTLEIAEISENEGPCAIQIFGHSPEMMANAARILSRLPSPPCAIDINMGCPVKKIVASGDGSALMKDPVLAGKIIESVVNSCDIPVTVKLRAGFSKSRKNAPEIAKIAQECGAEAVCVHGRTREDMYINGTVDYDIIAQTKAALSIPVIANGDITCGDDFARIMKYTNCDGCAIGRAAEGDPFVFKEIISHLSGEEYTPPSSEDKLRAALEHARLLVAKRGHTGVLESRRHVAWYTKGIRGTAEIRCEINRAESLEQIEAILHSALNKERIRSSGDE